MMPDTYSLAYIDLRNWGRTRAAERRKLGLSSVPDQQQKSGVLAVLWRCPAAGAAR